ncbi:hypothetical protein HMPREF0077_1323 [Anaerococcus tetradius ATCC 35098]|uniref:Uncharacterized protein n=1 Tax=Anaerococcus tetradius ATCC 35098 TaxID=525255 RepID=C2CIS0_9FIRM|nr:hypothetical protein HMPREF0077_1323 [Anaerococcus tetradius ATCC 35098]
MDKFFLKNSTKALKINAYTKIHIFYLTSKKIHGNISLSTR